LYSRACRAVRGRRVPHFLSFSALWLSLFIQRPLGQRLVLIPQKKFNLVHGDSYTSYIFKTVRLTVIGIDCTLQGCPGSLVRVGVMVTGHFFGGDTFTVSTKMPIERCSKYGSENAYRDTLSVPHATSPPSLFGGNHLVLHWVGALGWTRFASLNLVTRGRVREARQ
jgi:hypothetical protein